MPLVTMLQKSDNPINKTLSLDVFLTVHHELTIY